MSFKNSYRWSGNTVESGAADFQLCLSLKMESQGWVSTFTCDLSSENTSSLAI